VTGPVPFPTYEVPALVARRFPGFDPADPSTWPEPDRCTEGRPWGHNAYGDTLGNRSPAAVENRWRTYLDGRARPCRNRWRSEEYRLCGTHLAPFHRYRMDDARRVAARQRTELNLDLAKRLAVHGIEADGNRASGVLLQVEAVEELLDRLALLAGAIPRHGFPPTDTTVPPPL
jgi:hypothetical protein